MINKKMIKWRKLALGILTVTGSLLYSQQTITLKQAIEYALQNKSDALKAKLDITNAEAKILEAKAGALPKVTGNANITYNPIIQEIALAGQTIKMGQTWVAVAGVKVEQALFDQKVFIGLKAAKTTKEFYQLNADLADEQIIERVANAYYKVFTEEEKNGTLISSYTSTEKQRNILKSLFDNGLSKKIDLDRTNVKLTNIDTNIKQGKNGIALAENALKFYMGMPMETSIKLTKEDMEVTPHLLEDVINTDDRTDIKKLLKNKEMLVFQKKASEAAYYPTVNLTANYNWQGMGERFPLTNGSSQGVMWSDYSSIGLGVNVPIFNGFATKAKVQQNQIEIDKLEVDLKDKKLELDQAYQNSKSQIENNLSALENQKANVELAENVLKDTQSNYQYGLATLTDLLDAENSLVEAKNNYTTAVLDYKVAEVQYYKSKGELKTYLK